VDEGLVRGHELWIFPLLKRRWLFSGSENFTLYDFVVHDGSVDENVFAYSNRSGQEHALVLYHNRYGHTSGWLRNSVAFTAKQGSGEHGLCRTTLAASLGIEGLSGAYLAFRDLARGLEFIRPVEQLQEQGLFARLGEYEFHVFIDLRTIPEETDGRWGRLCSHLAGEGVPSLEEELIQLVHAPLIAAFEQILRTVTTTAKGLSFLDEVTVVIEQYLDELLSVVSVPEKAGIAATLQAACDPAICRTALRLLRRAGVTWKLLPPTQQERRLALATLLVRLLVVPPRIDTLHGKGLARPLASFIAGGKQQTPEEERWYASLCSATATAWEAWLTGETTSTCLAAAVSPDEVRSFMLVHESDSTVWFNKERFETLICRMAFQASFDTARGIKVTPVPVSELIELAAACGYRLRRFLHMAEEMTP